MRGIYVHLIRPFRFLLLALLFSSCTEQGDVQTLAPAKSSSNIRGDIYHSNGHKVSRGSLLLMASLDYRNEISVIKSYKHEVFPLGLYSWGPQGEKIDLFAGESLLKALLYESDVTFSKGANSDFMSGPSAFIKGGMIKNLLQKGERFHYSNSSFSFFFVDHVFSRDHPKSPYEFNLSEVDLPSLKKRFSNSVKRYFREDYSYPYIIDKEEKRAFINPEITLQGRTEAHNRQKEKESTSFVLKVEDSTFLVYRVSPKKFSKSVIINELNEFSFDFDIEISEVLPRSDIHRSSLSMLKSSAVDSMRVEKNLLSFRDENFSVHHYSDYYDLKKEKSEKSAYLKILNKACHFQGEAAHLGAHFSHRNPHFIRFLSLDSVFAQKLIFQSINSECDKLKNSFYSPIRILKAILTSGGINRYYHKKLCLSFRDSLHHSSPFFLFNGLIRDSELLEISNLCGLTTFFEDFGVYRSAMDYSKDLSLKVHKNEMVYLSPYSFHRFFKRDMEKIKVNLQLRNFMSARQKKDSTHFQKGRLLLGLDVSTVKIENFDFDDFNEFVKYLNIHNRKLRTHLHYRSLSQVEFVFDELLKKSCSPYSFFVSTPFSIESNRGNIFDSEKMKNYLYRLNDVQRELLLKDLREVVARNPVMFFEKQHHAIIQLLLTKYKRNTLSFLKRNNLTEKDLNLIITMASLDEYSHAEIRSHMKTSLRATPMLDTWIRFQSFHLFSKDQSRSTSLFELENLFIFGHAPPLGSERLGPVLGKICYLEGCHFKGRHEARRWLKLLLSLKPNLIHSRMGPRGHNFVKSLIFYSKHLSKDARALGRVYYKDVDISENGINGAGDYIGPEVFLDKKEIDFIKDNLIKRERPSRKKAYKQYEMYPVP